MLQKVQHNISLKPYNAFGIEVQTAGFVAVHSQEELLNAILKNPYSEFRILGGGNNVLLTKNFNGLAIYMASKGITIINDCEKSVIIEVEAGEKWHEFVLWSLKNNFGGVENLALIPGSVGAAPIQNIGAYGVELKDVLQSCSVLDTQVMKFKTLSLEDCEFGYRDSVFKTKAKGRYIILSVQIKLQKVPHKLNLDYGNILEQLGERAKTIQNIAQAIIEIRNSKLPDPEQIGNSGSFFKNPILPISEYNSLNQLFPDLPSYPTAEGLVKIPAAWLIETAGFKGFRKGDTGVHDKQALVLVNYGNATGSEILTLANTIQKAVFDTFDIRLDTEVNVY